MKIGVIKYKVGSESNYHSYLEFLERASKDFQEGFIIGPDYALANSGSIASISETGEILTRLKVMAKEYPDLCIVPGTMPMRVSTSKMAHVAPVFFRNQKNLFFKQTDHGEEALARENGMEYFRGPSKPNIFEALGKKCWLHICGDRDRKLESRYESADIEMILAHDSNAGFHITLNTPKNSRLIVLSDSFHPRAEVLNYDVQSPKFLDSSNVQYGDFSLNLFETK